MFYAYVLHSLEDHGLYIGFSTNLKKRIGEHERERASVLASTTEALLREISS